MSKIMTKTECCGNCRYWKTVSHWDQGTCHKNGSLDTGYLRTSFDALCDEFCIPFRVLPQ